jgi:hypothetical protein
VQEFPYSTPNASTLKFLQNNHAEFYEVYATSFASNPPQDALTNAEVVKQVNPIVANLFEEFWLAVKERK